MVCIHILGNKTVCVYFRYLVYVIGVNACVKTHVEVVEHLHDLQWGAGGRDGGEADDV